MKKEEKIGNFLANDTKFEGKLTCDGTIRIDGHFKGEILAHGTLIVGELGVVDSQIHARNIVISGEVHGDILADEKIEIRAPGKIFGNIQAPSVVINPGVIFEGSCEMEQAKDAHKESSAVFNRIKSEASTLAHPSPEELQEESISKATP